MERQELVIVSYLVSETSVLAANILTDTLGPLVYPNTGQTFLPTPSHPPLPDDL